MNWCEKHDHFKRTCPWCEVEELEQENKRLKELLAEKEAELEMLRESLDDAEMRAMDALAERNDVQAKLNQALEALKQILYAPSSHPYSRAIAENAIQQIKGEGKDVEAAT